MDNKILLICVFLLFTSIGYAQHIQQDSLRQASEPQRFNYQTLILPSALIGYGILGIETPGPKSLNLRIREEINERDHRQVTIDNFSQYAPIAAVYGLNALNLRGNNSFKDRTIILGTASLIMATSVTVTKRLTAIERPDGSSKTSFPSGHTATAFMGAEFLYQEYKDVSEWYGIAGYLVAAGTGFSRMYNDRHWLSDVVAGAGIGILSTKIAYWICPWMKKKLFKNNEDIGAVVIPSYNGTAGGLGLAMTF